jgi:hypothetical protein
MARYVEKQQASVRVSMAGEEPVEGSLSLAPQAQFHGGPETLLDLLNSGQRVLPLVGADGQSVLLLSRLGVGWVMPDPGVPPERVCPPTYIVTREERVEVRFDDGQHLEGLIQMELPEDLNRASDFLNATDDFFTLVTPFGTLLVNKTRLREVKVFESSPRPLTLNQEDG